MDISKINSHDSFFKALFSRKNDVIEFVEKTFPKELTSKLHLDTLEIDKTEYIDNKLRSNFSDLVYNCKYGNGITVKISLLLEHKSYAEAYPHFQLLGYMQKIWQTQLKQNQKLTPIIPVIFYHGKQKWHQKNFEEYFDYIDATLQKYIPKFDYQLIDISTLTDEQIIKLFENIELRIAILLMKNIFYEQKILQELGKFFAGLDKLLQTPEGEEFFDMLTAYLFYTTQIETQKFVSKMRTISPNAGEKFISTAMRLKMEGRKMGIEKIAFSMIKKGYTDEEIMELTGLTQEQIDYLRSLKEFELDNDL